MNKNINTNTCHKTTESTTNTCYTSTKSNASTCPTQTYAKFLNLRPCWAGKSQFNIGRPFYLRVVHCRVAGVGWLLGTATESLRAFGERLFANFRDKNIFFYNCGKTGHLWLSKDLHIYRLVPSNVLFDV